MWVDAIPKEGFTSPVFPATKATKATKGSARFHQRRADPSASFVMTS